MHLYTTCTKNIKKLLTALRVLSLILLFPLLVFAEGGYAPIMVDDIIIFVPYTHVKIDLGKDMTIGANEVQDLQASIEHKEEVVSYEWIENGQIIGRGETFSTSNLGVGTHTLTLKIIDINGIETTDEMTITIQEYITGDAFVGTTKGEFMVNQGAATYNLKIAVPPGVAGMEPKLSLNYNSNGGNGYMGMGWNIDGVSSINRCSQTKAVDGANHKFGVQYNSNDRFCLDGQRLINISGSYGANGTEYRTEINTYSKIVSRSSSGGGPSYFDVYTKSGLHYVYGKSYSTYDKRSGTPKLSWKVDSIIDSYGNTIYFRYNIDEASGIHYLDTVSYAGENASDDESNTVKYNYEDRPDVIGSYENGYAHTINKRLASVVVKTGSTEIRSYNIAYEEESDGFKRSKVKSITEHVFEGDLKTLQFIHSSKGSKSFKGAASWINDFGSNTWKADKHIRTMSDVNGDGLPDIVGFANDGIYVSLGTGSGFRTKSKWTGDFSYNNGWRIGTHVRAITDVNGDGLPDIVGFGSLGTHVALNTGSGFAASDYWSNDFGSNKWSNSKHIRTMADVNGDGLPDIVGFSNGAVYVAINIGNGFNTAQAWSSHFNYNKGWRVGVDERVLADVNGDGLPDIVGFGTDATYVALSTGNGFGSITKWSNDFGSNIWKRDKQHIRTLADVNGDGLPDIVGFGNYGVWVAINKGNGFKTAIKWTSDFGADNWNLNQHVRMLSDVNGDGLDDIVGFGNYAVHVALSTGDGFEDATEWVQGFTYGLYGWKTDMHERVLPDVDGDGLPDIVGFGNTAVWVGQSNQKNSLLTRITNTTDQDIQISYGNMIHNDDLYHNYSQDGERNTYAWNNIANDNIELSIPMSLVSSVSQIDGIGGYNRLSYKYFGYIANKLRGMQGFHAVNTFDYTHNSNSGVLYNQIEKPNGQGFQYTGMPYVTYEADTLVPSWDKVFSKTDITYKDASKRAKVYEPYTNTNTETIYDPKSKQHIKSVYQTNTLSTNGLGNMTRKVTRVYDKINNKNFYKTIENEYKKEKQDKWQIGRLSKSTVTHTQTDGGTVVRSSTFDYNSHGVLSEEIANVGTTQALKKTYTYDSHGNKSSQTISGNKITTATTTFGYSSDGKFQTSVTNAANLETTKTYDERFGTIASLTKPDGVTTRWYYDGIGRKIRERRADGTTAAWLYKWYGNATINSSYVHYTQTLSSGLPNSYVYYDSFGRQRTSHTTTLGGKRLRTSMKYYNKKGELYQERLPYIEGVGTIGYVKTTYDDYGRVIKVTKPGPSGKTQRVDTDYSNFTTIITTYRDSLNGVDNYTKKLVKKNAMGQVMHIADAYGSGDVSTIDYEYDAIGHLLNTTDSESNKIVMRYDAQGNKTYVNDPDLGVWWYSYRADGKLDTQWSGAGTADVSRHVTEIEYDAIGRVTHKTIYDRKAKIANATKYTYNDESFVYDGSTGRLRQKSFRSRQDGKRLHGGQTIPTYDNLGRVIETKKYIFNKGDFVSKVSYDAYSRPSRVTYPNGYSVINHYSYGILDQVTGGDGKVHYKINKLTSFGQVQNATYGNNVRTAIGYDDAGYVGNIYTGRYGSSSRKDVQNFAYTYDRLGNVLTRNDDSISGKSIKDSYEYDTMNRLTRSISNVGTSTSRTTYRYNSIGNMTYASDKGDYSYHVDKPHALAKITSDYYGRDDRYTYDSADDNVGNMTNRNGDSITYNAMNLPSEISGKNGNTVKFFYDTKGQRFQKEVGSVITYYIGKAYEEEVNGDKKTKTCYITLGGKTIGTHVEKIDEQYSINPSNPNYKTTYNRYFHTDALGSITAITDDSGKVIERRSYKAFGEIRAMDYGLTSNHAIIPRNSVVETTRAYTGHEQIKEIDGLIHMNARVYDSDTRRFLSADTVIQDPYDSQAYNRYSYVRNNPMNLTDPTGHSWLSKAWKKAKRWVKKHARTIAAIAASAVVAVVAPYLLPAMGQMATAAATGALAGAASGAIQTKSLKGALKGALFGAVGAVAAVGVVNVTAKVFNIAKTAAHSSNFISSGINKVTLFKAAAHGVARGAIQSAQGGSFKAGFMSGFSSAVDVGTSGYGGVVGRTTIMGIVGGTASALGGGKFSNGAMSGAFTHMFNAEGGASSLVSGVKDIAGKLWTLPNTIVGLAYGAVGHLVGLALGTNPSISIGHNAIQFHNNPFQPTDTAVTLGNTISYGKSGTGGLLMNETGSYGNRNVQFGLHEEAHTYQYQQYGVAFLPAYFASGGISGPSHNHFEQEAQDYGKVY